MGFGSFRYDFCFLAVELFVIRIYKMWMIIVFIYWIVLRKVFGIVLVVIKCYFIVFFINKR